MFRLFPAKKNLSFAITQHVYFWWVLLFFALNLVNRKIVLPFLAVSAFVGLVFLAGRYLLPAGLKKTFGLNRVFRLFNLKRAYNPRLWQAGLVFLSACFVSANFFMAVNFFCGHFQWGNFLLSELNLAFYLLSSFAFILLLGLSSHGMGLRFLRLLNFDAKGLDWVLGTGIGLFFLSLAGFVLAALGWLYAPLLAIGALTVLFFERKNILKNLNTRIIKIEPERQPLKNLAFLALFIALAISFNNALLPAPLDIDSLHSYFNAPNLYANSHQYLKITNFSNASMGQNLEMLYASAISLFSPRFVMHFSWGFMVLLLIAAYQIFKEHFSQSWAGLAVFCVFFVPWNFYFIYTAKTELGLAFYSFLSLGLFLEWLERPRPKTLVMSGLIAGIMVGIKYNALFWIMPLFAAAAIKLKNKPDLKSWQPLVLAMMIGFAAYLPWAAKNQVLYHNALYPYQFNLESGLTVKTSESPYNRTGEEYKKNRMQEVNSIKFGYNDRPLLGPLSAALKQAAAYKINLLAFFNYGFLPLISLPFLFFVPNKKSRAVLGLLAGYFLLFALFGSYARPWYAFSGLAMVYFLLPLILKEHKRLLFLYGAIAAAVFFQSFLVKPLNLEYISGQSGPEEFLDRLEPSYAMAGFLNQKTKPEEKILLLGDFRVAHITDNHRRVFIDPYLTRTGWHLFNNRLDDVIRQNNIGYIVYAQGRINGLFYNYLKEQNRPADDYLAEYRSRRSLPSVYQDIEEAAAYLEKNGRLVFEDNNYLIYEITYAKP